MTINYRMQFLQLQGKLIEQIIKEIKQPFIEFVLKYMADNGGITPPKWLKDFSTHVDEWEVDFRRRLTYFPSKNSDSEFLVNLLNELGKCLKFLRKDEDVQLTDISDKFSSAMESALGMQMEIQLVIGAHK